MAILFDVNYHSRRISPLCSRLLPSLFFHAFSTQNCRIDKWALPEDGYSDNWLLCKLLIIKILWPKQKGQQTNNSNYLQPPKKKRPEKVAKRMSQKRQQPRERQQATTHTHTETTRETTANQSKHKSPQIGLRTGPFHGAQQTNICHLSVYLYLYLYL